MQPIDTTPVTVSVDDPEQGAAAFAAVRAELAALPAEAISVVNLDIPRATAKALAHAPAIKALGSDIASALPQFPMHELDALEIYASAAMFAHTQTLVPREAGVAAGPRERVLGLLVCRHADAPLERSWLAATLWPDSLHDAARTSLPRVARESRRNRRRMCASVSRPLLRAAPRTEFPERVRSRLPQAP